MNQNALTITLRFTDTRLVAMATLNEILTPEVVAYAVIPFNLSGASDSSSQELWNFILHNISRATSLKS